MTGEVVHGLALFGLCLSPILHLDLILWSDCYVSLTWAYVCFSLSHSSAAQPDIFDAKGCVYFANRLGHFMTWAGSGPQ